MTQKILTPAQVDALGSAIYKHGQALVKNWRAVKEASGLDGDFHPVWASFQRAVLGELAAPERPVPSEFVVLVFSRGGPPIEVAREDAQWKAQAIAFDERRRGAQVEIEERPREAA